MSKKLLDVKDLCKSYIINKRQINVLRNINFTIDEGELVAVMGPSGSGKSTLLHTVSGMDTATAGNVYLRNTNLMLVTSKKLAKIRLEDMGFIFQQMYMLKNLTILDNIILPAFQAKKKGTSRKEIVEKAKALMRKLDIIEVADNDINEVSGGQLQRACICRSMINNPKIIFADEPTGALNRTASNEVMEELFKLNKEGTTIMLVTHDIKVAAICNRILFIIDGIIKGEKNLGEYKNQEDMKERERQLGNWLMEMGW